MSWCKEGRILVYCFDALAPVPYILLPPSHTRGLGETERNAFSHPQREQLAEWRQQLMARALLPHGRLRLYLLVPPYSESPP